MTIKDFRERLSLPGTFGFPFVLPFLTADFSRFKEWLPYILPRKYFFLGMTFVCFLTLLVFYKVVLISQSNVFSTPWILYGAIVSVFLVSRIPIAYLYEDNHEVLYKDEEYPSVSIIIAAKNEEGGIFKTISTCVLSEYPGNIECIVVNDGSTDKTGSEIIRAREIYGEIVRPIFFETNQGKREAMAAGVDKSRNEIIVFVDSDSFLRKDAIRHITEHFLSEVGVGAVSGNTKVENINKNILTRMQSIQYAISFDIYKTCESVFRAVTCCPGCFSAYRAIAIKPLIKKWKGHRFLGIKGTFGDDRGLTNFVLKKWNAIYCEKAKATTTVPEKFSVYLRQQLRWKKSWVREGIFAGIFMWKKHPAASLSFYTHFTFPFIGPLLTGKVLVDSIYLKNPYLFLWLMLGFILIGIVFSSFVYVYREAKNWVFIPIFSLLFVTVFVWQMPYAILTLRNTRWGTR